MNCLKDDVDKLLAMGNYYHSKKSINSSSESSLSESSSSEDSNLVETIVVRKQKAVSYKQVRKVRPTKVKIKKLSKVQNSDYLNCLKNLVCKETEKLH